MLRHQLLIINNNNNIQQGDPLGPRYFCLAFKELLESRKSELILGYLEDVALGGNVACVMHDFIQLEAAAKQLGL